MKRFYKLETGSLNLEDLLSSKTILNAYGFNTCIYCGKEIEKDLDIIIGLIKDGFLWGCMPDWKLYIN